MSSMSSKKTNTAAPAPPIVTLHTIAEVQGRLGVSRDRVFALIRAGRLEAVKLGARTTRIPSDSVDELIAGLREPHATNV
jgi:excisionase family DNA binding protein